MPSSNPPWVLCPPSRKPLSEIQSNHGQAEEQRAEDPTKAKPKQRRLEPKDHVVRAGRHHDRPEEAICGRHRCLPAVDCCRPAWVGEVGEYQIGVAIGLDVD